MNDFNLAVMDLINRKTDQKEQFFRQVIGQILGMDPKDVTPEISRDHLRLAFPPPGWRLPWWKSNHSQGYCSMFYHKDTPEIIHCIYEYQLLGPEGLSGLFNYFDELSPDYKNTLITYFEHHTLTEEEIHGVIRSELG